MSLTFFPKIRIFTLDTVLSTNDVAINRLKTGEAQNGDILVAKFQKTGRGQMESAWFSSPGNNLLVSFICKDIKIKVSQLPVLNMLVSLAVYNIVNSFFPKKTAIKWPNDIFVGEQKIAGLLIETTLAGEQVKNAVIGIGLNINEEKFPDNLPDACSLFTLTRKFYDIDLVFTNLCKEIDIQLSKLNQAPFAQIKQQYESVLFGMQVKRYFRNAQTLFEGTITGVNSEGQLCVTTSKGPLTFNTKEIAFELHSN